MESTNTSLSHLHLAEPIEEAAKVFSLYFLFEDHKKHSAYGFQIRQTIKHCVTFLMVSSFLNST